jgi:acylphosphatase
MQASEFLVSGRVQGVGFRASSQEEAKRLGIVGFANNLSDGQVRVHAFGSEFAMLQFRLWLQNGPPLAKVERVFERNLNASEIAALPAHFSAGSDSN